MAQMGKSAFLNSIVKEAIKQEASDVLLTFGSVPILKVEGKLVRLKSLGALTDSDLEGLISEVLPKSRQDALRQDRQIDLAYAQGEHRFRVNAFYQRSHISIVMRYVRSTIHSIDELGLPEVLKDIVANDNGLILMVGPTGSGKSTSLAAMIEHINTNAEKHIITLEDPIEYVYEGKQSIIEQREIGLDVPSFPAGLRSALREAPDVILLGEMRDLESVSSAITVAETGHLVLSTVHANNAAGTIDRIIDIFPPEGKEQIRIQLADILLGVFNQRLIPRADGNGSMVIVETMIATSAVRNAIRTANSAQLPNIIQTSAADGMYLLDDLLIKAVKRGEITKESALAFANDRTEVRKQLHSL
jgi:twitching motility protein PilT